MSLPGSQVVCRVSLSQTYGFLSTFGSVSAVISIFCVVCIVGLGGQTVKKKCIYLPAIRQCVLEKIEERIETSHTELPSHLKPDQISDDKTSHNVIAGSYLQGEQ